MCWFWTNKEGKDTELHVETINSAIKMRNKERLCVISWEYISVQVITQLFK